MSRETRNSREGGKVAESAIIGTEGKSEEGIEDPDKMV